ncbi:hypothetical protein ACFORJ_10070 [Corynebacterium hansenii]|uniref:Uncharacterized protein n=1 Tax=Corynebacterium hansenii TaxID=394964 RepID=A0ABV7ZQU9_9CORY|nr:hypothetical protein [Corynebacterium hansenii]WJZ01099.1 hypothetical protein CHAN_12575 [Corynebacterium hansenii]
MLDDNQPDLNLAETAPMHLDADVFDGLLDYALDPDAHDVDDSIVPDDAPDDAPADDDLDAISLADDADDPLDDPIDDGHAADAPDDTGAVHPDVDGLDDVPVLPGDPGAGDDVDDLAGIDAADDADVDPSPDMGDADPGMEW